MSNDTINDKITQRIHEQLMDLLPEDEIRQKVDYEIDKFFNVSTDTYGRKYPSLFAKLVENSINEKITKLINEIFNSKAWSIEVSDSLEVTIGSVLQNILKIEPSALRNLVTEEIAIAKARDLAFLLRNSVLSTFNDANSAATIAHAIDLAISNSIKK